MTTATMLPDELPAWRDCTPAQAATPAVALRSLRRRDELSRKALSRATGLKMGRIADMESGKRRISSDVAAVLARAFRTAPSVFR